MDLLEEIGQAASRLALALPSSAESFTPKEHEAQWELILLLRKFWAAIPNDRVKAHSVPEYLAKTLGVVPSKELVEMVTSVRKRQRLSETLYLEIERRQNSRCRLCGCLLQRIAEPEVDHIVPIALGGTNELENLQLLCRECNAGKSDSFHWLMLMPFFLHEGGTAVSLTLRYCVLQRFGGRCAIDDCAQSSLLSPMRVSAVVPLHEGGRPIFDNLRVLCERHYVEEGDAHRNKALARLKPAATAKFSFSKP